MTEKNRQPGPNADIFIAKNIDSVPHLEALVLFWKSRPSGWTCDELARRLYISADLVSDLIRDLVRLDLISEIDPVAHRYAYFPRSLEQDHQVGLIEVAYRTDLVRISNMIHSKASSPIREFARAFRFKKERD